MMPSVSPGSSEKEMPLRTGTVDAGRQIDEAVDRQPAIGPGQGHALAAALRRVEEVAHAPERGQGEDPLAPAVDQLLERLEHAAHQDAGRHGAAGGGLALDHQHGRRRDHGDLEDQPEGARRGAERLGGAVSPVEQVDHVVLAALPALGDRRQHAHRLDHFGIADGGGDVAEGAGGGLVGLRQRAAGQHVGQHAHQEQEGGGAQRQPAIDRVQQEQHDQEQGDPHQFQRHRDGAAGDEGPQVVEVADRLGGVLRGAVQRVDDGGFEGRHIEPAADHVAHDEEDARPDEVEHGIEHQSADRDDGQHDQRIGAAAGHDAVVNLHRVERHDQHEQVHETAQHCGKNHAPAEMPQSAAE